MRKAFLLICIVIPPFFSWAQGELFSAKLVLNQKPTSASDRYFLNQPFGLVYGPDDSLWISERRGRVIKVDPVSGKRRIVLNISSFVRFTTSGNPVSSISQDGMMGMALHPDFPTVDSFYVAYVYDAGAGVRKTRIARYPVRNTTITTRAGNETVILENIPGSADHSTGRLIIGPDRKLYYGVGDMGANQFSLRCNPIRAQDVPTTAEMTAGNYVAYQGKVLRINLNGSIPVDNPTIKSIKTHIYTFGHRNPTSLAFARNGQNEMYDGAKLYSAEHGPATDDEVNQLFAGKNYGWPYISGYRDDYIYQYKNWSSATNCAGAPAPGSEPECSTPPSGTRIMNETDTTLPDFQPPMRTLFTPNGSIACFWLSNPTVAPSAMIYYGFNNKIPGWENSLLMATLKEGTIFRMKLSPDGNSMQNMLHGFDTARYFRQENRFRDLAVGSDGITFYMITDSVGQTSGPTGGSPSVLLNRGSILVYTYNGSILNNPVDSNRYVNRQVYTKMYPNPASNILRIESKRVFSKPIFYQVYDMTGRVLLNGKSFKDNFDIPVSSLMSGIYSIKLYNAAEANLFTDRLFIQR